LIAHAGRADTANMSAVARQYHYSTKQRKWMQKTQEQVASWFL